MGSTRPFISKSSSPFINFLVTVSKAPITIRIILTSTFHRFFNSLARWTYSCLFLHSFNFTLRSAGTAKSTILQVLFFSVAYYKVWSSGWYLVIRLYPEIKEEFVCHCYLPLESFSYQLTLIVFHWNLSDNKSLSLIDSSQYFGRSQ